MSTKGILTLTVLAMTVCLGGCTKSRTTERVPYTPGIKIILGAIDVDSDGTSDLFNLYIRLNTTNDEVTSLLAEKTIDGMKYQIDQKLIEVTVSSIECDNKATRRRKIHLHRNR
jgi:hypothetical protein